MTYFYTNLEYEQGRGRRRRVLIPPVYTQEDWDQDQDWDWDAMAEDLAVALAETPMSMETSMLSLGKKFHTTPSLVRSSPVLVPPTRSCYNRMYGNNMTTATPCVQTWTRTVVTTLPIYTNRIITQGLGRIRWGVWVCQWCSYEVRGSNNNGRGMVGYSYKKIVVNVAASDFDPAVLAERISRQRQVRH